MRLIGQLESKQHAERFAAYLTTKEISSHVEPENGSWEIWIRDEDQINSAVDFLNEFKTDPEGGQYRKAVEEAQTIYREEEKKRQQQQKNLVAMQNRWNAPITKRAPLTIVLVVICVIVALATNFGGDIEGAITADQFIVA